MVILRFEAGYAENDEASTLTANRAWLELERVRT